jgi:hypothetical protein
LDPRILSRAERENSLETLEPLRAQREKPLRHRKRYLSHCDQDFDLPLSRSIERFHRFPEEHPGTD